VNDHPNETLHKLRIATQRLSALFQASPDAVFLHREDLSIVDVNQRALEMFGYSREQMVTFSVRDLSGKDYVEKVARVAGSQIPVDRPMELEWIAKRSDGSEFPVDVRLIRLKMDIGDEVTLVAIVRDISERLQISAELRQHQDHLEELVQERTRQLEASNQEMEAFSYSVSHDLRAPLRSIDGFSQLLLEECDSQLDATARNYLQRVRANTQRMGHLIDDLLLLSRVTRRSLSHGKVDLSGIASAVAADLRENEPERVVEFHCQSGIWAQGDEKLLRVVLENLLGNAWKYTRREAHPVIEFGVERQHGADCHFVRDNGVGFDMNYHHKLFGAFQRLHSMEEFPGTGIGLATVQRIIHRHGGRVWAEGQVGTGATFYFTLPTPLATMD
jgi:PAS domain S-box-containing protein